MKLKVWSIFALFCLALPAFVGCSDDDNEDSLAIGNATGTYSGSLNAKVMTSDFPMEGEFQLSIVSQKDNSEEVTVVLPQCSFTPPGSPMTQVIPSISVADVDIEASGSGYTIKEDNFMVVLDDVTYTGSINGTISGNVAKINYSMTPGKMPMQINFTFNGTKN